VKAQFEEIFSKYFLDGIPLVFIKLLLPLILPVQELFNYILTCSTSPLVWKISSVVPIPKVHSPTEKSDYRPTSVLPVLAKALENVEYEQSGLRPGHRVSDEIRLNMESNQLKILV
jgi:hypothetical protein